MLKLIYIYLIVTAVIAIINLINIWRCIYISVRMEMNVAKKPRVNYKYVVPVYNLLDKFYYGYSRSKITSLIDNSYGLRELTNKLAQVRGVFHYKAVHSFAWPLSLVRKFRIFKFITDSSYNIVIKVVLCLLEGFAVYLLSLYLDTSGIGDKILSYLTAQVQTLIEQIQRILG